MKNLISIILTICFLSLAANVNAEEQDASLKTNKNKVAVVYFSASGRTKAVANTIAKITDGKLYEIIPAEPYNDHDLNYRDNSSRANHEQSNSSSRPQIKNDLTDSSKADVIYLGYPIWWGTVPRIIQTYLEKYDLSNKKVYVFCTAAGSNINKSILDLKYMYPNVSVIDGKRLDGCSETEIKEWINSLK